MFLLRRMMIFLFLILYMQYFIFLCRNFKNSFFTYWVLIVHNDTITGGLFIVLDTHWTVSNEKLIYLISRIFSGVISSCLFLLDVQLIRCWISWIGSLILSVSFLFLSTLVLFPRRTSLILSSNFLLNLKLWLQYFYFSRAVSCCLTLLFQSISFLFYGYNIASASSGF